MTNIQLAMLPGTEGMKCAMGLYEGSRKWVDGPFKGRIVHGVFSKVDLSDNPCTRPVRVWCKWSEGTYAWLACDDPAHQKEAAIILPLDGVNGAEYIAFLVWQQDPRKPMPEILKNRKRRNPFLDAPRETIEVHPGEVYRELLPPKKPIPRNKGSKAKKRLAQILGLEKKL